MSRFLLLLFSILGCFGTRTSTAQKGKAFDSSLQAALAVPGDADRRQQLLALGNKMDEASSRQVVAFHEALLSARIRLGDDSGVITSHIRLGMEFINDGRYNEALAHLFSALTIAERLNHYPKQVEALTGLGIVYKSIGEVTGNRPDFAHALAYYDRATALAFAHGVTEQESQILSDRAVIYDLLKMRGKAIALYRAAIAKSRAAGRTDELIAFYINMGITLKNDRQYGASLEAYRMAAAINDSLGNDEVSGLFIADNQALLYHAMGKDAASEATAEDVIGRAAAAGIYPLRIDMLGLLSRSCEGQGRYAEALDYANKRMMLKDTVLNKEKAAQIEEVQGKYEARKKDERIAVQTATIVSGRKENAYLWVGLGLLAATGGAIYAVQRRTRRLNQKILQQQGELEKQKSELQQLNNLKDRLFTVISHDLRSPVSALTSFLMLLEETDLPRRKLDLYIASLKQLLSGTTALLENLLHFARLQMQGSLPALQPVDTAGLAGEAIGVLQPFISAKAIRIVHAIPPGTVALADPQMLSLVFRNLLANAIKFSHEGGAVYFSAALADGRVSCTVKDEGTGLQPALLAAFNDPGSPPGITYGSMAGTRREKGTGLGLMLCKTYTVMMGGSIRAEGAPGAGAAFTVTLPVAES